ncbi:uncharacterized protein [Primulina eburnea]|uniref:uncharacterized protein isoform X1 n=1 Tax=Primulina eburnea TaxID=1245227 RepID=UPI003C6C071C
MNHCAIQHNYFVAREEMRGSAAASGGGPVERRGTVICPKPRRLGLNHTILYDPYPMTPRRWHICHQQEVCEANAANEVLDIILAKGSCGADQSVSQVSSSPPFFSGSPPRRVSNPLIQDARFVDEKLAPVAPRAIPIISGRFVQESFGNNPAVRVEGFDCLDKDRRNRHIPALA